MTTTTNIQSSYTPATQSAASQTRVGPPPSGDDVDGGRTETAWQQTILATLAKKTFCTVATTSPAGWPHSAGVVYTYVDQRLWVHTTWSSRKARNVAANGRVGVCVPFRVLPVGPPYTMHFQARASVIAMDDPRATGLIEAGELKAITGHGALEMADGCFLVIEPHGALHSFGPGTNVIDLIRDPLNSGARRAVFPQRVSLLGDDR